MLRYGKNLSNNEKLNKIVLFSLQISIAVCLDLLCGDPKWFYHPVRGIGSLCTLFERICRNRLEFLGTRLCGIATFFLVLSVSLCILAVFFSMLQNVSRSAAAVAAVLLLYLLLAAGDLLDHSRRVYSSLQRSDIVQARADVAMLVGRETDTMNEGEIARACVESVAENTVDGVTAPLFWAVLVAFLCGDIFFQPLTWAVFGACFYKCVNTMDSMFGYRNERYVEFGWLAARFDDLVNFIPARLTALFIVAAAFLLKLDYRNGARILSRDRLKSSSPNSGHPEAAVSGVLNIELGGPAIYFGQRTESPRIGAGQKCASAIDIKSTNRLCIAAALIFFIALLLAYNSGMLIFT